MRALEASLQQLGEFLLKARRVKEKAAPYCVRWARRFLTRPASDEPLADQPRASTHRLLPVPKPTARFHDFADDEPLVKASQDLGELSEVIVLLVGKRVFGAAKSRRSNGATWISASDNCASNAPSGMAT